MTTTELAPAQTEQQVSLDDIRRLSPLATEAEIHLFYRLCLYYNMNPIVGDAYLIKYSANSPATTVVGKDFIVFRASQQPDYQSYHAGIVYILNDDTEGRREGAIVPKGAKLIGGYCRLHPRRRDPDPTVLEVACSEYDRGLGLWKTHPATMIRKVAVAQAHREAYPGSLRGLYDPAEMPVEFDGDKPLAVLSSPPTNSPTETCPIHNQPWQEGQWGHYHFDVPNPACKATKAYMGKLRELWDQVHEEDGTTAQDMIKAKYDRPWGQLSLDEILEVLAELEDKLPVVEVEAETGEII